MPEPNDSPTPADPIAEPPREAAAAPPDPAGNADPAEHPPGVLGLLTRQMHYPNAYAWLLLLSAMDVMLTWTIFYFGGAELNPIADAVIKKWELNGMIVYKFVLILFFIMICEVVGTLREPTGKVLSRVSVAIAMVPVVWSMSLLFRLATQ